MTESPQPPPSPDPSSGAERDPQAGSPPPPGQVEAKQLSKSYGHTKAVSEVSFSLHRGEILGFLGPNGAGKSTTLKMITGTLVPDRGTAIVDGIDITVDPLGARGRFGYLPESLPLYWEMQVEEYLRFIARGRGMSGADATRRIGEIVERLGLGRMRRRATGALSKGYRQRVGLAQAMLHDPPILILDEPTNGLDPQQIVEIRALLRELSKDRAILFSTHILQEIAAVCTRIMVIHGGRKVADERPEVLAASAGAQAWEVLVEGGEEIAESARAPLGLGSPTTLGSTRVYPGGSDVPQSEESARVAAKSGGTLVSIRKRGRSLEEVYLGLTGAAAPEEVTSAVGSSATASDSHAADSEGTDGEVTS